jgi:hypothetical protein
MGDKSPKNKEKKKKKAEKNATVPMSQSEPLKKSK